MSKKILNKILCGSICLLVLWGCNRFHKSTLLGSVGYDTDECVARDWTHHSNRYANGMSPSKSCIRYRRFMCRIERVCIGKSEIENEACRQEARNYWGQDERKPKICDNAPE